MTRRGKILLAVLVVGSILGLVAATNAWFIAVSSTPPGTITSALVRYLPEGAQRSFSSLLTYGNLISGSGVDPDGIPLVLPGDRLLSSAMVDASGNRTVRTSIAREFDNGPDPVDHPVPETVDTVIHWEVREADGAEVIRKQRDLMDARTPEELWYLLPDITTPISPPQSLNPTEYDIVTTSGEETETGSAQTKITTRVTTAYNARKADIPSYQRVVTTVKIITHEAASYTPSSYNDDAWAALPQGSRYIRVTETVLFVRDNTKAELQGLPTRSYLVIEQIGAGGTETESGKTAPIPLKLGNLSTVGSCVRVGLNARLTTGKGTGAVTTALTFRGPDEHGAYYLGTTTPVTTGSGATENRFIELISFRPYSTADYSWTKVQEQPDVNALWGLWDLTLTAGTTTTVPPAVLPSPDPSASTPPSVSPSPEPAAPAEPVVYIVTDQLGIVSAPSSLTEAADAAEFEILFNQLYCDETPTITVHLSYYARQSEFMDWNEFYSEDLSMSLYQ